MPWMYRATVHSNGCRTLEHTEEYAIAGMFCQPLEKKNYPRKDAIACSSLKPSLLKIMLWKEGTGKTPKLPRTCWLNSKRLQLFSKSSSISQTVLQLCTTHNLHYISGIVSLQTHHISLFTTHYQRHTTFLPNSPYLFSSALQSHSLPPYHPQAYLPFKSSKASSRNIQQSRNQCPSPYLFASEPITITPPPWGTQT